jgi:hypothetical protein
MMVGRAFSADPERDLVFAGQLAAPQLPGGASVALTLRGIDHTQRPAVGEHDRPLQFSPRRHVYDRVLRVSVAGAVLMRDDRKERLTAQLSEITEVLYLQVSRGY